MSLRIRREISEYNEVNEDLENMSEIDSIQGFFDYFREKYPNLQTFTRTRDRSENCRTMFESLKIDLGWRNVYTAKYEYLWSLSEREYDSYLNSNLRAHRVVFQARENYQSRFGKLADKLHWNDYINEFKNKFLELVEIRAHDLSKNLVNLQNIIRRYQLLPINRIPNDVRKCKTIIKHKLFVNIYDFISEDNTRHFRTLNKLIKYTKEAKMFYPKKDAKNGENSFILKVLLHRLL